MRRPHVSLYKHEFYKGNNLRFVYELQCHLRALIIIEWFKELIHKCMRTSPLLHTCVRACVHMPLRRAL